MRFQKRNKITFAPDFLQTLMDLKHAIGSSKPVVISKTLCTTWYVFTDGAYEPDSDVLASIGEVLISPTGTPVQCFGEVVPKTFVDELLQHSSHPIYELEVLPVVMATRLWISISQGAPQYTSLTTLRPEQRISKVLALRLLPFLCSKTLSV